MAAYAPGSNVSNQFLDATKALGPAEPGDGFLGSTNGVASLGDNGAITLTFPAPITDGPGADFAVFENAFTEDFLEFAFVEVSSDGTNFTRFPCHTLSTNPVDTYASTGGTEADAIGGLAGKHLQGAGTPFDLRALAGTPGLDVRRVTHVRLVDVARRRLEPRLLRQPHLRPDPDVGSGGFDLDAVGVLNPLIEISTGTERAAARPARLHDRPGIQGHAGRARMDHQRPGAGHARLLPLPAGEMKSSTQWKQFRVFHTWKNFPQHGKNAVFPSRWKNRCRFFPRYGKNVSTAVEKSAAAPRFPARGARASLWSNCWW